MDKHSNIRKTAPALIYLPLLFLFLMSCGEDRREEYYEETKVDRWIEKTMLQNYYWYKEIPSTDKALNYFMAPDQFFQYFLSKKDGKIKHGKHYPYSYIEELNATTETRSLSNTENSYGFEFASYSNKEMQNIYLRVLYVIPDSPAHQAGLQRGDWIIAINKEEIDNSWINQLFNGGGVIDIQLAHYDNEEQTIVPTQQITLPAARAIEDNPVYTHNIIAHTNYTIGYLAYNHFTPGKKEGDSSYDQELRKLSKEFKEKGVNEFVLDLRYNNGGYISSASLLCEILAPASAKNNVLFYLKYNDKHKNPYEEQRFNESWNKGGVNLDLNRLYVLTSNASASASELVINCLSPYMEVILIGTQTEGKNVGSTTYTDEDDQWAIHPIICEIFNAEKSSDYSQGFTPNFVLDEFQFMDDFYDLGDPKELLFNFAIHKITNKETATLSNIYSRGVNHSTANLYKTSLDRKASPVIINLH